MDKRSEFYIHFEGLKEDLHHFEFEVDDAFFSMFESSLIEHGSLKVALELNKKSTMMELNFSINGMVTCDCDLCGDPLAVDMNLKEGVIAKYGDEGQESTDELTFIPPSAHHIDVAPYIYEFIVLAMPSKNVHKRGACNPRALELLKKLNAQSDEKDNIDPRWSMLRQLKNLNDN